MKLEDIFLDSLKQEGRALIEYEANLSDLEKIIEIILESRGKVFISGVGKSGLIAQKIVATLSSTGTPSVFLHPVEAMHGDLGVLEKDDIFIAISYSGESPELNALMPHVKKMGLKIITLSKDRNSTLSKSGDYFLSIRVDSEVCPLNTAPTTSTTLTLAIGDALAICLMKKRDFTKFNFALFHPGGSLGRDLFLKVKDIMRVEGLPLIDESMPLREAILIMSEGRLGSAIFINNKNELSGVLSDGDLRRAMMRDDFNLENKAFLHATKNPKFINNKDMLAIEALKIMQECKIQLLIVVDNKNMIIGLVQLYDLVKMGFKI